MKERITCGACKKICEAQPIISLVTYECKGCGAINEITNIPITEWVGFNYKAYLAEILKALRSETFIDLRAVDEFDQKIGKLNDEQLNQLRNVLRKSFKENDNIKEIATKIQDKVNLPPLLKTRNGTILTDDAGVPLVQTTVEGRSISIARTEAVRLASKGALNHYANGGVKEVAFVSSLGARTCPVCDSLNGRIFTTESARGVIPVHPYCRCSFVAVRT